MKKLKTLVKRKKAQATPDPNTEAAKITHDNLSEHREEVLSSARKYIYPLQHSKHRIVLVSVGLFITVLVAFFTYCTFALYKAKSTNGFLYGVTRVVPFPVAKAGSSFVSYENYLFELRHYVHFYENQQKLDFKTESGRQQLEEYKKRALDKVIADAYVKQLAKKNGVSVSNKELENQINIVRQQNRLGASEKGFEDVLKENFGWSVSDFKRYLKQQMLAQKVAAKLDSETVKRAETAQAELKAGANFADVAKKYSEDVLTKDNGGEYPVQISKSSSDISPQVVDALFKLQPGQVSELVNSGFSLEIIKNIEVQTDKIRAAHIQFNFKDVNVYVNDLKEKEKAKTFIKL